VRLYLIDGCPFAHRAAFALAEKGLAFEVVAYDRARRPPELVAVGPRAKSPTLFDGDHRVHDSTVVLEYLEDRYPEPALLPADPAERAAVRMAVVRFGAELEPKFGAVVRPALASPPDEPAIGAAKAALVEALGPWDALMEGRTWVVGDAFGLADIVLYTQFPAVRRVAGFDLGDSHPNLRRWLERVAARPGAAFPSTQAGDPRHRSSRSAIASG
jgi:glutathione S-transferase